MKKAIIILLGLILTNCNPYVPQYDIYHYVDEFDGFIVDRMQGNKIYNALSLSPYTIEMNAGRTIYKNGEKKYYLQLDYSGSDWFFIQAGESTILLIDSERFGLTCETEEIKREVKTSYNKPYCSEQAYYKIEPELLKKISAAKEIKIKVIGQNNLILKDFEPDNINNLRAFYLQYVKEVK